MLILEAPKGFSPQLLSKVSGNWAWLWRRHENRSSLEVLSNRWRLLYLEFAASSPALYEVMFSLGLSVPFGDVATPPELRFAFSQILELFQGQTSKPEVISELFWAGLHGIAELTRTKRFPRSRQKERIRELVDLFTRSREESA